MKKKSTTYRLNKVDYSIFIICSLAALAMLYLFYRDLNSFTIKQNEEPIAKIYFKRNTAQRKFSDNDIWEVLTNSSDIYDGDRIRTSKNSEAYTEFNDSGIQIQLREKSMVQIFKNKKQRSVDFIGGEIFVATTKPEEKLVIHSGKNEISIGQVSEVKLSLPEVSAAVASGEEEAKPEDNTVVIEVVSGQVEVIEIPETSLQSAGKTKDEKSETQSRTSEPIVIAAGEKITLVPTVVQMAKAKAASAAESAVAARSALIAETAAVEEETVLESVSESEVSEESEASAENEKLAESEASAENEKLTESEENVKSKQVEEVSAGFESVEASKPADAKSLDIQSEIETSSSAPVSPEPVKTAEWQSVSTTPEQISVGVENALKAGVVSFQKNKWGPKEDEYNYHYSVNLGELTEPNKKIPAGSVLEFTLSGESNNDIRNISIQVPTGATKWEQAHQGKTLNLNNGEGIKSSIPFTYTTEILLNKAVVNTSWCNVEINYGHDILDELSIIYDFTVKVRVLSVDEADIVITPVSSGYTKTLEYENLTLVKNKWGNDYRIDLNSEDIFGNRKLIAKGTKVKITISGTCDRNISGLRPELENIKDDQGVQIFMNDKNRDYDAAKIDGNKTSTKNKEFSYTKEYKAYTDLPDTTFGIFHFIVDDGNSKKNPVFSKLKISFEVE